MFQADTVLACIKLRVKFRSWQGMRSCVGYVSNQDGCMCGMQVACRSYQGPQEDFLFPVIDLANHSGNAATIQG